MKRAFSLLLSIMLVMAVAVTSTAAVETIVIGTDTDSGIALADGLLKSGETYRFPVLVSVDGAEPVELTDEILDNYSFRISNTGKGESLTSLKLSKKQGAYYIVAEVKAGWPAEQTEEEYSFKLVKKSGNDTVATLKVEFLTGYAYASDEAIAALEKEDYIEVDNDAPVYTAEQLEKIEKINLYKKVTFSGDNWTYTVNATDMDNVNMLYYHNTVKEILTKYEDNSFDFLTFPAGPKFSLNGTVEVDVSNYADNYNETFFVYRYLGGKLTLVPSTYDSDEQILSFNTNTLGRFVITDKQIKDAVVVAGASAGTSTGSSGTPVNPSTGAAL